MPSRDATELAQTLLRKAAQDEFALERLAELEDAPDEVLGFHAQQAAEKLIKAVLASSGVRYERSHDLRYLMELAEGAGIELPLDTDRVDALTDYAVPLRYEDPLGTESLARDDAREIVRELRAWAQRLVGSRGK